MDATAIVVAVVGTIGVVCAAVVPALLNVRSHRLAVETNRIVKGNGRGNVTEMTEQQFAVLHRLETTLDEHMGQDEAVQRDLQTLARDIHDYTHERWHKLDGRMSAQFAMTAILADPTLGPQERKDLIDRLVARVFDQWHDGEDDPLPDRFTDGVAETEE